MIIPDTPLYNSKTDAEFRIRMIDHIKETYKDLLGSDVRLLDLPNGLDLVQARVQEMLYNASHGEVDLRPSYARKKAA